MFRKITHKTILVSLTLVLAFLVIGCKEQSSSEEVKFVLTSKNIFDWREVEKGFLVRLTRHGNKSFYELTKENVSKPMNLYIDDLFVNGPIVIREPIAGDAFMFNVDTEMKKKVLALLPAEKRRE